MKNISKVTALKVMHFLHVVSSVFELNRHSLWSSSSRDRISMKRTGDNVRICMWNWYTYLYYVRLTSSTYNFRTVLFARARCSKLSDGGGKVDVTGL